MAHDLRSDARIVHLSPAQPVQTPLLTRVWMAFLSVAVSGTVIGGMLGLFELHAEDAVIARAAVKVQPATVEAAVRSSRPAARG